MKKGTTKITESQLRRIIKESVTTILNEGGHLYHKDEDGNVWTNSKELYRNIPGTTYIWHGEWADPEVIYEGHEFDVYEIEDEFQTFFKMDMEDEDTKQRFISETGANGDCDNDNYEKWIEWVGVSFLENLLSDLVLHLSTLNEGFVNNLSQGTKAFFGNGDAGSKKSKGIRHNGGLNLGKRINAAKTNYQMTKEGNEINEIIKFLEDMVEKKQLTPQTTIADLIGGNLNKNKYGRLHAMRDNRTSRASKSMNDIYRK